jgi:hypothetical protein
VQTGDVAGNVSDRGEQRRPGLVAVGSGRRVGGPVEAARMEAERPQVGRNGNATGPQIGLGERIRERIGRCQQQADT